MNRYQRREVRVIKKINKVRKKVIGQAIPYKVLRRLYRKDNNKKKFVWSELKKLSILGAREHLEEVFNNL